LEPWKRIEVDPVHTDQPIDLANRRRTLTQLRWVGLVGVLLVGGLAGELDVRLGGVAILYGLVILWASLSTALGGRRSWIDGALVGADACLGIASVGLSGGVESRLWWALLLPVPSAASLFGPWMGVGLGMTAWAVAGAIGLSLPSVIADAWQRVGMYGGGLLAADLLTAWLAAKWPIVRAPVGQRLDAPADQAPDRIGELMQLTSRLNESETLDHLSLRIIDLVNAIVSDDKGSALRPAGLWIGSPEDGDWEVTIGFAPGERRGGPGSPNALEQAMQSGQPQVAVSRDADSFLQQWPGLETVDSFVFVPLYIPGEASLGAVVAAARGDRSFGTEIQEQLSAAGRTAALVWENVGRYRALLAEKERLNELQEEARRRLARNLHDGPTQSIASIAMRANFARRQITRDPDVAEEEVAKVEEMARQTTREIRHMLFTLRPLILESQGLGPALYQLALKARDSHEEDIQLEIDPGSTAGMDPGLQGALFYIVEEAVTNAQKHAAAQHIWIRLKQAQGGLRLEVEDDGVGFNVGAVDAHYEQRGSLGMVNMRERAELAGGVLSVRSTEGEGTCISVSLPHAGEPQDTPDGE
jgi:signal transduction histidine kinase